MSRSRQEPLQEINVIKIKKPVEKEKEEPKSPMISAKHFAPRKSVKSDANHLNIF
jgi:hypothetical protein